MNFNFQPKSDKHGVTFTYFDGVIRCYIITDPGLNLGEVLKLEVRGEGRYLEVLEDCQHERTEYRKKVFCDRYTEWLTSIDYLVSSAVAVDVCNRFIDIYIRDYNLIKSDLLKFDASAREYEFLSCAEALVNGANSICVCYYKKSLMVRTNLIDLELLFEHQLKKDTNNG